MRARSSLSLVGFLAAAFGAAALGGWATASSVGTWYVTLHKPGWNPPGWLFGPVWTVLYAAMAVAAWRVWRTPDSPHRTRGLRLFFGQLALNALWSALFFGLRRPDLALVDIGALLAALFMIQFSFWRCDRIAGGLWIPYVAWVSFASALNATVWWLNR